MKIRPSSLPFIAACPCWETDEAHGEADKSAGTNRHALFAALLRCDAGGNDGADVHEATEIAKGLPDEDQASAAWAAEYAKTRANTSTYPLHVERRLPPLLNDAFDAITKGGTPDATCGPDLFDLKSRDRDYTAQMIAYALMMIQEDGWPEVHVHLMFTETKRIQRFTVTEAEGWVTLNKILEAATASNRKPTPCDYCTWCKWQATCAPYRNSAAIVANHREDLTPAARATFHKWLEAGAHSSALIDQPGDVIAAALRVAADLEKFCAGVKRFALEAAQKRGVTIPGYEIATKRGRQFLPDVPGAFALAGLPQDEFLKACAARIETSKKYPDQVGLVDLFKNFNGIKAKAAAKRDLLKRLEPVTKQAKDSTYLRAVKDGGEAEGEE